jgi:hypothetical protein
MRRGHDDNGTRRFRFLLDRADKGTVSVLSALTCASLFVYQTRASWRDTSDDTVQSAHVQYLSEEMTRLRLRMNDVERYGISAGEFKELTTAIRALSDRIERLERAQQSK